MIKFSSSVMVYRQDCKSTGEAINSLNRLWTYSINNSATSALGSIFLFSISSIVSALKCGPIFICSPSSDIGNP